MSPKKRGRPPFAKEDRRNARIQVVLSSAELRGVTVVAQREGKALSAWARGVLLSAAADKSKAS